MTNTFLHNLGVDGDVSNQGEPIWLAHLRSEAASRLLDDGLPTNKTEAWRFTSLRGLLDVPFTSAGRNKRHRECQTFAEETFGETETNRLYLVNGRPIGFGNAPADIEIHRLAQILADQPESIQPYLARHARSDYFGALNSALFQDGLAVHVHASTQPTKPLHVVHISDPDAEVPISSYPRLLFLIDANAEFSLIETYLAHPGAADLCTAVTEVVLKDGAKVEHVRNVLGNDGSSHLGSLAIHQGRDSRYTNRSVVMGGKLTRIEIEARLAGPGAECNLEGMYDAIGKEHVAHHTTIIHEASNCSSKEEYRGLIDDSAHAVFDGIIKVERGTTGTSAHQQNHNLLLSDSATVNTKPHLEIDSDDLAASHGATIGALDPDQLFFLRARGIDEDQARAILTYSFVRTILDRISCTSVRGLLADRLLSRMPNAENVAELAQ